jgi:hypothetical protein
MVAYRVYCSGVYYGTFSQSWKALDAARMMLRRRSVVYPVSDGVTVERVTTDHESLSATFDRMYFADASGEEFFVI